MVKKNKDKNNNKNNSSNSSVFGRWPQTKNVDLMTKGQWLGQSVRLWSLMTRVQSQVVPIDPGV